MNSVKFRLELANLLSRYKLDKITGFDSKHLSKALYEILLCLYDFPSDWRVL